ncbi:MAG TPA: PEP/pyruvate-binding domain-containing protein, partial [Planctomycetota bacterium]|nr:PEP/pyruvate-binding domain-containing protein [Planctomycetota bacterium]
MAAKRVYFFGARKAEGRGDQKELLGGKGAGLAEMTRLGLPVPGGFTITTEVCDLYYRSGKKWPRGLDVEIKRALKRLEKVAGKKLGDPVDPLLVSVRSGAARSMPGMMETILNLGLNDKSVEGLARGTGNPRFAYDAYRRFITMYGATAQGIPREKFDHEFQGIKDERT